MDGGAGAAARRVAVETVAETFERKRDYLAGFLAGETRPSRRAARERRPPGPLSIEALKSIYDPEIPVDIYELGLIYDVDISEDGDATITMTLTTPHCPVAESLPNEVELRVLLGARHPRLHRQRRSGTRPGTRRR